MTPISSSNLTSQVEAKATGQGKHVVGEAWKVRRLNQSVFVSLTRC